MTATFGKLHTETLTLSPGLNVLEMPNETGKSTWCAFLLSMLYGVDTSERETRTNFPLKKHYAPWSGSAMEGSIRLEHEGRRITIERSSTARAPLGVFRAYDTESGLPIEELTAQNCGQMLLGVPRQVFERSAFLRQDGMTISMDATLEQRLGALVTTGDETISYQDAERVLRERRNRCRHNKTGLIPQTEAQLSAVNEKLSRLTGLHETMAQARLDEQRLRGQLSTLRMQLAALQARQAEERRMQLTRAGAEANEKIEKAKLLEQECRTYPSIPALQEWERNVNRLQADQHTLALDIASVPPQEPEPAIPAAIAGLEGDEIIRKATVDASTMRLLQAKKKPTPILWAILTAALLALSVSFAVRQHPVPAVIFGVFTAALAVTGTVVYLKRRAAWLNTQEELHSLYTGYGVKTPAAVEDCARACRDAQQHWVREKQLRDRELERLRERKEKLEAECADLLTLMEPALGAPLTLSEAPAQVRTAIDRQMECESAHRSAEQAYRHYCTLKEALGSVPKVTAPLCPVPEGKTVHELQADIYTAEAELQKVRSTLDRGTGQCQTLGDPTELEARRQALAERLDRLNQEYDALSIALTTIGKANETLQNRFSPRLTALAAEYLDQLTDGTYSRLMLDRNLGASLYPAENPASRDAAYFSGGTRDQLYLAVRLAVSELLAPGTPLILDDALVRFDDERMKKALEVLQKEAKIRQVLLFTCQSRENAALKEMNDQ